MKWCTGCGILKSDLDFNFKNLKLGIRHSRCNICTKIASLEHYRKNKEKYKTKAKINTKKYRLQSRDFVWDYLTKNPCVDCGESNPIVLEFDHVRATKTIEIGKAIRSYSIPSLKKEIAKCEVRCANCHKIKTAKQFGYWKDKQ